MFRFLCDDYNQNVGVVGVGVGVLVDFSASIKSILVNSKHKKSRGEKSIGNSIIKKTIQP